MDESRTITFDSLMTRVQYVRKAKARPYWLYLFSRSYYFEGTEEIVPFVEKNLGIKVTGGGS